MAARITTRATPTPIPAAAPEESPIEEEELVLFEAVNELEARDVVDAKDVCVAYTESLANRDQLKL